jgi:ubiquinone biosynthesis protein COQ9
MTQPQPDHAADPAAERVLEAALAHVPFDGWSETTLRAAAREAGVEPGLARTLFPRGGLDLAVAFHRRGDRLLRARLAGEPLAGLRFRDRVARAVWLRLEIAGDREAVRRGATLFALPQNAAEGARLMWETADTIWTALGDTSRDVNWYTKRATLSGVTSATVLYWLGDDSPGAEATRAFLDRRIDDVMQIEKVKAAVLGNPLAKAVLAAPAALREKMKRPEVPGEFAGRMMDRFRTGRAPD